MGINLRLTKVGINAHKEVPRLGVIFGEVMDLDRKGPKISHELMEESYKLVAKNYFLKNPNPDQEIPHVIIDRKTQEFSKYECNMNLIEDCKKYQESSELNPNRN